MKTTKSIRTLICAAAIMTLGCFGLSAHSKASKADCKANHVKIERTIKHQPPKANAELRTIAGKIGSFNSHGTRFITIASPSKRTYVINIDDFARNVYKNIPGNQDNFTADDEVTLKYLLDNMGSKVVLTGLVNRETGVFSVIKTGTIARPQESSEGGIDAK